MKEKIKSNQIACEKCNRVLKIMKISILLFLLCLFSLTAGNMYPQQTELSLDLRNVTIKNAISEIEKTSDYVFLITDEAQFELNKRTSIRANKKPIHTILETLLKDTQLGYAVVERQVSVYKSASSNAIDKPVIVKEQVEQQKKQITGTIIDKDGEAIIGANIIEKGTSNGTVTDVDGNFSLSVEDNAVIQISYIGYLSQEIQTANRTNFDIILAEDTQALEELVVVGYGVQKRRDITGAVVSIKPDDMRDMPQANIVQSLQGKLPGVSVTNTDSNAEGDTRLRIRAQNSITADASPLIILDGIQYEGFLSEINPNDIESMEVLKDASSAAIYGAKAANGVILITTKKGMIGKPRINFDSNIGFSNFINLPDMMTGEEYYQFKNDRMGYVGLVEEENYLAGINTNWIDYAMRTGIRQEYNLSVSGGTDDINYYISGNAALIEGVAINDTYNRYAIRFNLETKINSWLKFGTNNSFGYYDRPGSKADISSALQFKPLMEPYDEDGNLDYYPDKLETAKKNPLEALNYTREDVARATTTNNYLHIDFPFLKGLSYRIIGGYFFRSRLIEQYKSSANTAEGKEVGGDASVNNQYRQDWSIENIVHYQRDFGKHSLNLTGVYSARQYTTKFHNIAGVNFPTDSRIYYQFKDAGELSASDEYTQESSISQMFRINYSYHGKYLFTATARRDGFSAFGANTKYGIFPSVALGWNMEEEDFLSSFNWVDRSKLRLSYGENGNQAINAYSSMATLSSQYYLDNAGNVLVGFYPNKLADPTLSWETTRQVNAGWDFSFLRGRISGSLDGFFANTYDLLLYKKIPQINGVNQILQNVGRTQSKGIELALSTVNIQSKDFMWKTDLSFAHSRNKIRDVGLFDENGNPADNVANRWFISKPINVIYSYKFDGIWQEDDDILNSHMPAAKPGDVKVLDYNQDGEITEEDMHIIGYKDPLFTAGLMNTLSYKNLTLSLFFNTVYGVTRYTEYMNTYFNGVTNIRSRQWWTADNPINTYPANRDDSNPYGLNYFGKENDASYIRLSDISLSYKFPSKWIQKAEINRLEVFTNVKNVFTLTNYIGLDPEFTSDYSTPLSRTFIIGLRLEL